MRLLLLYAAALMTATGLRAMQVVVNASDMHLVEYVADCNGQLWIVDQPIHPHDRAWVSGTGAWRAADGAGTGRHINGMGADQWVVATPSRISWHVVGGVPPYRLIDDKRDLNGVCITVRDALGNEATGCAVVGVRRTQVMVDCPQRHIQEVVSPAPLKVDKETRGVRSASSGAGAPRPGTTRTRDGRHTGGDGPGPRQATRQVGGTRGGITGQGGNNGGTGTGGGLTRGAGIR